jgi:hypothetical protein
MDRGAVQRCRSQTLLVAVMILKKSSRTVYGAGQAKHHLGDYGTFQTFEKEHPQPINHGQ